MTNVKITPPRMSSKSCTPQCTRCGKYSQNARMAVRQGLCCNKCPNHGPWCTMHRAHPNKSSPKTSPDPPKTSPDKLCTFARGRPMVSSCQSANIAAAPPNKSSPKTFPNTLCTFARGKPVASSCQSANVASIGASGRTLKCVRALGGAQKRNLHAYGDFIDIPDTQLDTQEDDLQDVRKRSKVTHGTTCITTSREYKKSARAEEKENTDIDNFNSSPRALAVEMPKWIDPKALCKLIGNSPALVSTAKVSLESDSATGKQVVDNANRMENVMFDEMSKLMMEIEKCEGKLVDICEKLNTLKSTEAVQVGALKAECAATVCSLEEAIQRLDNEIMGIERDESAAEVDLNFKKEDIKQRIELFGFGQDTQEIEDFRCAFVGDLDKLLKAGKGRGSSASAELKEKRGLIREQLQAASDEYKRRRDSLSIVREVQDLQSHRSLLYDELDWLQVKYSELAHHAKRMH